MANNGNNGAFCGAIATGLLSSEIKQRLIR